MAVLRNKTRDKYTTVDNVIVKDSNISLKTKGLLLVLLSLPDNWEFSEKGLSMICSKDGITAIRTALKELEVNKYLKRQVIKNEKGQFFNVEWLISEKPILEKPILEKPILDFPISDITHNIILNNNNTKELKKEIYISTFDICVNDLLDTLKGLYNKLGYNKKFCRTATYKRVLSILKAKDKRKLYPLQIIYSYNQYLQEKYNEETEVQFIKGSDVFLTSSIYDYADKVNELFEKEMTNKYGAEWRKIKFNYIE